ncbi:MAG TPA: radical SAM protein [Bacilli bacterium]|nr:radical SAM protein [Bacilli bacterium]
MKNSNKKLTLLLVYPDFTEIDTKKNHTGGNYSEGLASISAVIKKGGYNVKLFHMHYQYEEEEFKKEIKKYNADLIGFSIRTTMFLYSKSIIKWAKEACPKAFVHAGGYHAMCAPLELLNIEKIDAVCVGEGEYPTLELMDKMSKNKNYYDVKSFYFNTPKGQIINEVRPLVEDLDTLPFPDFELFDYDNLISTKLNTLLVMVSRGCIFSCTYCGNSLFRSIYPNKGKYARFRSPENAIKYLKVLLNKYPKTKIINFRDAIFNMYAKWFDEFIELYNKEIKLPFTCNLRFDLLTESVVKKIAEAGCYQIDVGLESGDEEIRKKYLKRFTTDEQMINSCNWFNKYKIKTLTYNIVGLPYENLHKVLKTIKLNAKLKADEMIPNIFTPFPQTELEQIARKIGIINENLESKDKVFFEQKGFSKTEVLFAATYFNKYIRRYKKVAKMPKIIGGPIEKFLDWTFTSKLVPKKILIKKEELKNVTKRKIKKFLRNKFPELLRKLKMFRINKILSKRK